MKLQKMFLFCLIASLFICPVFAEDENQESPAVVDDETAAQIKQTGKQVLNDMKDAFGKASEAVNKQIKSITSNACVGAWIFTNGKCETEVQCSDDGSMTVTQSYGKTTNTWSGQFNSTSSTIVFHIYTYETKTLFTKKSDAVSLTWNISYKVSGDKEMKLSSDDIPNDNNGYDFSNATLFVKK